MPKSICNRIADPAKRKRCLERFRSEQDKAPTNEMNRVRKSKPGGY